MRKGSNFRLFLRAIALTCLLLQVLAGGAYSTTTTSGLSLRAAIAAAATAAENASGLTGPSETAGPVVPVVSAASLSVFPTTIQGGLQLMGEVTLNGPAPAGNAVINLSSSTKTAQVPRTVTVFERETSVTFAVKTRSVLSPVSSTLSATYGGVTITANLLVIQPGLGLSVRLNPTTVQGGSASQGTVTLTRAAPSGGAAIVLSSSLAAAGMPSSVTIPTGSSSATFTVSTTQVSSSSSAIISASYAGASGSATLTITPPPLTLVSLNLNPASVVGGTPSQGTVTLSGAAPSGGAVVSLSSSNTAAASVPASVIVQSGSTSANFNVSTSAVQTSTSVSISGNYNNTTAGKSLTVTPAAITSMNFYVAPNGSPSGNGSINSPWDLQTALNHPPAVHPGDTIWLRGGTYTHGPGTIDTPIWVSNLTGTAANPIHVKQYPGERATIDGNSGTRQQTVLAINGSYTWYWDFEVTNSHAVRTTNSPSSFPPDIYRWNAIDVFGASIKLIHLVAHDNGNGICPQQGGADAEVYGVLSYNNGWYSFGNAEGLGHGFYIQNNTGTLKKFRNNIVFNNFFLGFQAYGQGSEISNLEFTRNAAFNNGSPQGLIVGTEDFYRTANLYVGNPTIASRNITIDRNWFFHPRGKHANQLQLGNGASNLNVTVTNNFIIGSSEPILWRKWQTATVTGNTVLGRGSDLYGTANMIQATQATGVNFSGYTWNSNTYYDPSSSSWYWATVCSSGNAMSFADYKSCTGFDASSVRNSGAPSNINTFVEPSIYEPGRANIVVYSFSGATSTTVNISSAGLSEGDAYDVRDAQNFFGAPVATGIYHVSTPVVTLPLNNSVVAKPVGLSTAPAHTGPEFNVFVIMKH